MPMSVALLFQSARPSILHRLLCYLAFPPTPSRNFCYPEMSALIDAPHGNSGAISVPSVQELALNHPDALPERYIASPEERPSLPNHSPHHGIPVIDMSRLLNPVPEEHRRAEMANLARACEEWGFFQVVNHGIPLSLLERARRAVRGFFELPQEEKKECAQQPSDATIDGDSVQGYGQAFVVSESQRLDWADMLFLLTLPAEIRKMNFWPTNPADFRETLAEYALETEKLGDMLLSLLAENLGLEPHDYFVRTFGKWSEGVRMNYYPPCPRPELVLGLSPHSDASGITMLLQDDRTEGLQVRKDGEWVGVQVMEEALVINIGDMVEIISNGKYKSIEHLAVTNAEKGRISVAAFYSPGMPDTEIGPAAPLVDGGRPCLYRRLRRGMYEERYLANKLDGKKAIHFAKIHTADAEQQGKVMQLSSSM